MKAKAIEHYPNPGYPTRSQVDQNPRLMQRSISAPVRRLLETGISGAMALLVPLSGCDRKPAGTAAAPTCQQIEGQKPNGIQTVIQPTTDQKVLLVAPIFQHGEGRGSMGCVVVAPPAFLTEEEGLAIIKEELSKKGIQLENKSADYEALRMSVTTDLLNEPKQIVIDFISEDDYRDRGGWYGGSGTALSYDFLKVAQDFRTRLAAKVDHGVYGIFYEPAVRFDLSKMDMPKWREKLYTLQNKFNTPAGRQKLLNQHVQYWRNRFKQLETETKNEAKELLRKQVQDFAKWLADNKVI